MPSFLVERATQKKTLDGQHGPMQVIDLILKEYGAEANVGAEWYTKATTPLPTAGSSLEGTLEPSQYGMKFKRAQQQGAGGFTRGGRSPEENRRIVRQHSQDMAIRWAEFAHLRGKLPDEFKLSDLIDLTERFHKDAMEGGQA